MGSPAIVTEFRLDTDKEVGVIRAIPHQTGGFEIEMGAEDTIPVFSTADLFMASEFFRRLAEASVEKNDGK